MKIYKEYPLFKKAFEGDVTIPKEELITYLNHPDFFTISLSRGVQYFSTIFEVVGLVLVTIDALLHPEKEASWFSVKQIIEGHEIVVTQYWDGGAHNIFHIPYESLHSYTKAWINNGKTLRVGKSVSFSVVDNLLLITPKYDYN